MTQLVSEQRMSFAFETVFSHLRKRRDGSFESRADNILQLQKAGYLVVLLFVGLTSPGLSLLRVQTRKAQGGHDVPRATIYSRFPRTQRAVGLAAPLADMTLMFDNSRTERQAFALVRAQRHSRVLFDCRDESFRVSRGLRNVALRWLPKVAGK